MSELGDLRKLFTSCFAKLLVYMLEKNYQPMIGKDGLPHAKNSLHYDGLAGDVDLCDKDGKYLSDTESHRAFTMMDLRLMLTYVTKTANISVTLNHTEYLESFGKTFIHCAFGVVVELKKMD